ncbi:RuvC-like Holliday junction resolvase [Gordonia phage VanDeWege]|uniref:RuvC-like resolvase n=3 Tax=Wizardvirus TaxID=2169658 RepID=A0A160DCG0_9CAUD|nr:RuvC-like Holliday junction resolvase [Gordonia phage Wizard]YP_010102122.1 RuvC-like Holliday junction resolvase [Gordonia phage VanDeWege]YP_010102409.1 RuvC-like Holliday junction resolvase [Gordonia phage Valary]ANA85366.1 RuvC-like resolvase [Gordonia phage Wizard]QDB74647.1 RuvC-like resolvase [Gordonia phage VanDeWege]QDB74932.1 RuvC-like resolvase [Gordonia phage Valary]
MTTVIGLDLSLTSTGIATIAYDPTDGRHTTELQTITSTPRGTRTLADRAERLRRLRSAIVGACRGADLVCVESPAFAARGMNTHDLNGNWWLVVAGLHHLEIPVAEVPVATVKKFATDSGGAKKADVAAAITRMWPDAHPHGDDQFDALALASIALVLSVPRVTADTVGMPFRVLERHRQAIAKVLLPESPRRTQLERNL